MTNATSGLAPVRHVLPNGTVVIVQETEFSPAVTISLAFRVGSLNEPDGLPGLAWFLARVIDRGTTTRSADAIAEALDDRGVALRAQTNRHVLTLSCTCLSEDFNDVLAVLADVARHPVFPEDEIEKRRAETITAIRQDLDNPGIRASEALQALLYGASHPYGRPAKGTVASVETIRRAELAAYAAARFAPCAVVVIRGRRAARGRRRAGDGGVRRLERRSGTPARASARGPSGRRGSDRDRDGGKTAVRHRTGSPASAV